MFDHVTIRVCDLSASRRCYSLLLDVLEGPSPSDSDLGVEWGDFSITQGEPTRGLHVGFAAPSREHIARFWQAGVDAGYEDDGAPGPRPEYGDDYWGAFLLDPDGNSVEAARHDETPGRDLIDHLWVRVSDLAASRRFYERLAPHAGLRLRDVEGRVHAGGARSSFALLEGAPTRNLHWAFPAASNDAVDAFHADLVAAGYRDNGAPGERPEYHAGYYGAFVLDPDGTNVELVCHNR
ncbi:MAG TPA: VOC family protein [Solirubrobacteraceae bacterium]